LPFNLTKTLLNAALVWVLYKPVSVALKKARVIKGGPNSFALNTKTVLVMLAALALIAACVVVFLVVLKGKI
jgi:hypothetical protein